MSYLHLCGSGRKHLSLIAMQTYYGTVICKHVRNMLNWQISGRPYQRTGTGTNSSHSYVEHNDIWNQELVGMIIYNKMVRVGSDLFKIPKKVGKYI